MKLRNESDIIEENDKLAAACIQLGAKASELPQDSGDCLEHNDALRAALDTLKAAHERSTRPATPEQLAENSRLKAENARIQGEIAALNKRTAELTAARGRDPRHATQADVERLTAERERLTALNVKLTADKVAFDARLRAALAKHGISQQAIDFHREFSGRVL